MGWTVHEHRGSAAELHALDAEDWPAPSVHVMAVSAPAVVLGSTQRDDVVDRDAAERLGWNVARRRSGGGLVLVDPVDVWWVDVVIARGDPRWDDDVARAFAWVGEVWLAALRSAGEAGADSMTVHRGPMLHGDAGRLVCFAGVGSGEVVDANGAKVVGMSQRRTRSRTRFQCSVLGRVDVATHAAVLAASAPGRDVALDRMANAVAVVRNPTSVLDAVIGTLAAD